MPMKRPYCRPTWVLGLLACLAAGCGQQATTLVEDDPPITSDTPLVLRINDKSQIFLHQRWVDLYVEQGTVRNYLRKQAERYRQACAEEGVALIQQRQTTTLSPLKEYLPTEVVLEVMPKSKAGSISHVKRVAHEYGFTKFRVETAAPPEG
jgi:hypothetical protein